MRLVSVTSAAATSAAPRRRTGDRVNTATTVLVLIGFAAYLLFIGVNISVAVEIAEQRHRSSTGWAIFAFLFPVVGPLLVYMLPPKP